MANQPGLAARSINLPTPPAFTPALEIAFAPFDMAVAF